MEIFAYYLHNIDPVLMPIWGPIKIRWYGFAYVIAFIIGFSTGRFFIKKKLIIGTNDQIDHFNIMLALFGILVGGRLGYLLFYDFANFISNPFVFFKVYQGGMSAHGGIIGTIIYIVIYSKYKNVSASNIGDFVVSFVPLGIFFGRLANFINGELYGRAVVNISKVSWAMQFPGEIAINQNGIGDKIFKKIHAIDPNISSYKDLLDKWPQNPQLEQVLRENLAIRHPSQLYEALLEGLIPFIIIITLRLKFKKLYHGVLSGIFFIIYSISRFWVEYYREPDAPLIWDLTQGQFYSLITLPLGIGLIMYGILSKKNIPIILDKKLMLKNN